VSNYKTLPENALQPFEIAQSAGDSSTPTFERKGGNGTDTRHRHQAAANRVMLNHLKNHSMQSFVAVEDCPPYIQHGLNHHRKYWIAVLEQLPDACRAPNPFARIGS
jgi:hypothetical protein